jgi:hypothetical protein
MDEEVSYLVKKFGRADQGGVPNLEKLMNS